jgi:dipeptidyl aminopeptidase/acylaminoacyl peptidase
MSSPSGGAFNLHRKAADGTGTMDRLTTSPNFQAASDWSPDGKTIAFVEFDPVTGPDIWLLDVDDPKRAARPWLQTPATERYPTFSPDGRWLAYASNESGRTEVYVQPYPGPGPRVLVSTEGGDAPAWRGDGAELFYPSLATQSSPRSMMAVPVQSTAKGLTAGAPRRLFDASAFFFGTPVRGYDVTRDGQRFLMVPTLEPPPQPPTNLVLVSNWLDELRRRVPVP